MGTLTTSASIRFLRFRRILLFTLEVALRPGAANEAPTEIREKDKITKIKVSKLLNQQVLRSTIC